MTSTSPEFPVALELAQAIKEQAPRPIVLGGTHVTITGSQALAARPCFDYGLIGEAEEALPQLARCLEQGGDIAQVPGIIYRDREGGIVQMPAAPPIVELDTLAFPARELLHNELYARSIPRRGYRRTTAFMSSRGCPFHCSFCATQVISPGFTQVPVETVVSEIRFAASELNQTQFTFYDDALFVRPDRHIKPILRQAMALGGDLRFHTPNGLLARFIDRELAELMAAVGFIRPRVSLETIHPDRLSDISNKVTRGQYLRAIEHLHHAGYPPGEIITYLIAGLPTQTVEQVEEAVDFAFSAGSTVTLSMLSPIPSTEEYRRANLPADVDPLLLNTTVYPFHRDPDLAGWLQTHQHRIKNRNYA